MKQRFLLLAVIIGLLGLCLPILFLFSTPFLIEVEPAQELREAPPDWGEAIPEAVRASALLPDSVLDEVPCDWRPLLEPIVCPVVRDCRSAREATLALASQLGELTGVHYSRERSKPSMNVCEALEQKKTSCTGQSILLVCALRAAGIPARAVGVATWNHLRGNHTWAEAWFDGAWHMVEANEQQFNTPWVMEAIGMLDAGNPHQRILATHPQGTQHFPTPWNPQSGIPAEDVSARYRALARQWYEQQGLPAGAQKLMVELLPRPLLPRALVLEDAAGCELARATLPTPADDMRKRASLPLPRSGEYYLRVEGMPWRQPVRATEGAAQVLTLRRPPF